MKTGKYYVQENFKFQQCKDPALCASSSTTYCDLLEGPCSETEFVCSCERLESGPVHAPHPSVASRRSQRFLTRLSRCHQHQGVERALRDRSHRRQALPAKAS